MNNMKSVSVIILNYMNYLETEKCVISVLKQSFNDIPIIIVDNGSTNESYNVLKKLFLREKNVHIIKTRKNLGFAKGNNIGIKYARDNFKTDFILLLNSDTVLIDSKYIDILISKFKDNIGVIGSEIIDKNNELMQPHRSFVYFPDTLIQYILRWGIFWGFLERNNILNKFVKDDNKVEILHGSHWLLTPAFFEKYEKIYDKTFLYCEENLLFIQCKRAGLRQYRTNDTKILHEGKQSSKLLNKNSSYEFEKSLLNSYKYVLIESFKLWIKEGTHEKD